MTPRRRPPNGRIGTALAAVAVVGAATLGLVAVAGAQAPAGTSPPASVTNSTIPASTATVDVIADTAYYSGGPTFDAYLPKDGRTDRPALIMVHGGGWTSGDKAEMAPFALDAADEQGWAAFAVDYRLDPADPSAWPDELHDVQAAIRHIVSNAATYGIDPAKVVLLGGSAGGNLVGLISTVGTVDPVSGQAVGEDTTLAVTINAVALWSPPVDLADLVANPGSLPPGCDGDESCDFAWSSQDVVDYIGCEPSACPQTYQEASPLSIASAKTAPTFIANSSDELVPIDQIDAYVAALQKDGVAVQLDELPGTLHSVQYGGEVWDATATFLGSHLPSAGSASDDSEQSERNAGAIAAVAAAVLVLGALVVVVIRRRR